MALMSATAAVLVAAIVVPEIVVPLVGDGIIAIEAVGVAVGTCGVDEVIGVAAGAASLVFEGAVIVVETAVEEVFDGTSVIVEGVSAADGVTSAADGVTTAVDGASATDGVSPAHGMTSGTDGKAPATEDASVAPAGVAEVSTVTSAAVTEVLGVAEDVSPTTGCDAIVGGVETSNGNDARAAEDVMADLIASSISVTSGSSVLSSL